MGIQIIVALWTITYHHQNPIQMPDPSNIKVSIVIKSQEQNRLHYDYLEAEEMHPAEEDSLAEGVSLEDTPADSLVEDTPADTLVEGTNARSTAKDYSLI